MFKRLQAFLAGWRLRRRQRLRQRQVMQQCGCVVRCPGCHDILNDQADCDDDPDAQQVHYLCGCGVRSRWTFDAAPVPLLLSWEVPQ